MTDLRELEDKRQGVFGMMAGSTHPRTGKLITAEKETLRLIEMVNDYGKVIERLKAAEAELERLKAQERDYFSSMVSAARGRAEKAMRKFPQPNYVLNKVAEESGEVIKAVIHYTEGREEWCNVEGEIIDNLAMLIRLVTEGDGVIGFTPPKEVLIKPRPAAAVPEWTDEQCLAFLSVAFRHAKISGDIQMDDIRLAVKMINAGAKNHQ